MPNPNMSLQTPSALRNAQSQTWATLPAANSVEVGTVFFVSDVGINGSDWYSNGTKWISVQNRIALAMSHEAIVSTGVTGSRVLATVNLPPSVLGSGGAVDVTTLFSSTNNANSKSVNVLFGGAVTMSASLANSASCQMRTVIRNRSATSQIFAVSSTALVYGATAGSASTSSINTAQSVPITISVVTSASGDSMTLESYIVELIV